MACRGYLPGEAVSLFWNDARTPPLATGTAGKSGTVTLSAKAPSSSGGRHKTIARGETSGKRVSTSVTVQPRIALSPDEGTSGTKVTVELTGFKAGETVSVRFYTTSSRYTTVRQSVTVAASGGARFTVTVPDGVIAGGHSMEARGSKGSKAATVFDVTPVQQVRQAGATEDASRSTEQPQRLRPTATSVPDPESVAPPKDLPADTDEPVNVLD